MSETTLNFRDGESMIEIEVPEIRRNSRSLLYSTVTKKRYMIHFRKGRVMNLQNVVPFGYTV